MNTQLYYAAIRELERLRGHLRIHGGPHEWASEILRRFSRAVSDADEVLTLAPPRDVDEEMMYLGANPTDTAPPEPAA